MSDVMERFKMTRLDFVVVCPYCKHEMIRDGLLCNYVSYHKVGNLRQTNCLKCDRVFVWNIDTDSQKLHGRELFFSELVKGENNWTEEKRLEFVKAQEAEAEKETEKIE